ncbi:MAG: hypothetical protein ACK5PQ_02065 [Alphaproteobacteria bacterium]
MKHFSAAISYIAILSSLSWSSAFDAECEADLKKRYAQHIHTTEEVPVFIPVSSPSKNTALIDEGKRALEIQLAVKQALADQETAAGTLLQEQEKISDDLKRKKQTIPLEESQIKGLLKKIESLTTDLESTRKTKEKLEKEKQDLKSEKIKLQALQMIADTKLKNSSIGQQEHAAEKLRLESELKRIQEAQKRNEESLRAEEEKIADLNKQLILSKKDKCSALKAKEALEKEVADLEGKLSDIRGNLTGAHAKVAELTENLRQAQEKQDSMVKKVFDALGCHQLGEQFGEHSYRSSVSLADLLKGAQIDEFLDAVQEDIASRFQTASARLAQLEGENKRLSQAALAQKETFLAQEEALKKEGKAKQQKIEQLEVRIYELEESIQKQEKEYQLLQGQLNAEKENLVKVKVEKEKILKELETLQDQHAKTFSQLAETERQLDLTAQAKAALEKDHTSLNDLLKNAQNMLSASEVRNAELASKIEALELALKLNTQTAATEKTALEEQHTAHIASLTVAHQKAISDLESNIKTHQTIMEKLSQEKNQQQQVSRTAMDDLNARLQKAQQELEEQKKSADEEIQLLSSTYEQNLKSLNTDYSSRLEVLEKKHHMEQAQLEGRLEEARKTGAEGIQLLQAQLVESQAKAEKSYADLQHAHTQKIDEIHGSYTTELKQQKATLLAKKEGAVHALRIEMQQAEQAHASKEKALTAQLDAAEQALVQLQQKAQAEQALLSKEYEEKVSNLQTEHEKAIKAHEEKVAGLEADLRQTKESLIQTQSQSQEEALAHSQKIKTLQEQFMAEKIAAEQRQAQLKTSYEVILEAQVKQHAEVMKRLEDQKTDRESLLKETEAKLDGERHALGIFVSEMQDLQGKLDELGTTLATHRTTIAGQERTIRELESEKSKIMSRKTEVELEQESLKEDIVTLKKKFEESETQVRSLNAELEATKSDASAEKISLQNQLSKVIEERDILSRTLEAKEQKNKEFIQQLEKMGEESQALQARLKAATDKRDILEKEKIALEEQSRNQEKALSDLRRKSSEADTKNDFLSSELRKLEEEVLNLQRQKRDQEEAFQKEKRTLEQNLRKSQEEALRIQNQLTECAETLADILAGSGVSESSNDLVAYMGAVRKLIVSLNKNNDTLTGEISNLEDKVVTLTTEKAKLKQSLLTADEAAKSQKKNLEDVESKFKIESEKVIDLDKEIRQKQSELDQAEETQKGLQNEILSQAQRIEDLKKEVISLNAAKDDLEYTIGELKDTLDEQSSTVLGARNEVESLSKKLTQSTRKLSAAEKEMNEVEESFREHDQKINEERQKNHSLERERDELKAKIIALETDFKTKRDLEKQDLEKDRAQIESHLRGLEDEISVQKESLALSEEERRNTLNRLEELKVSLEKDRAEYHNLRQAYEAAVQEKQMALTVLEETKTELSALKKDKSSIDTLLAQAKKRQESLSSELQQQKGQVYHANKDLEEARAQITELEEKNDSLTFMVDKLKRESGEHTGTTTYRDSFGGKENGISLSVNKQRDMVGEPRTPVRETRRDSGMVSPGGMLVGQQTPFAKKLFAQLSALGTVGPDQYEAMMKIVVGALKDKGHDLKTVPDMPISQKRKKLGEGLTTPRSRKPLGTLTNKTPSASVVKAGPVRMEDQRFVGGVPKLRFDENDQENPIFG